MISFDQYGKTSDEVTRLSSSTDSPIIMLQALMQRFKLLMTFLDVVMMVLVGAIEP
jgi:hypothetical protein